MEVLAAAARLILLVAGLLVPGTLLLRAGRVPWSLVGGFVSSCALLYVFVLGCTLAHLPITTFTLAAALTLFSIGAGLIAARRLGTALPAETPAWAFLTSQGGWTPLCVAFWGIALYRLGTDPLSGPDVHFRWSYLAEQMLRFRTLDFYPPRTGGDFVRYFWPESIPPGIASLYAWAYGCAGSRDALWTTPVVLLQLLSLHDVVWRLAFRRGGAAAARLAVVLLAACPLVTWSFFIGQETGLLTIAVAGLVWCLGQPEAATGRGWAALTASCAIAAASTREYGLAYPVAAAAVSAVVPTLRRQLPVLAAVALPVAAAWPVRVWMLTGNPFYSLDLVGLFPVNAAFASWNDAFRAGEQTVLGSVAGWLSLARYLALWALPALLGCCALTGLVFRRAAGAFLLAGFAGLATVLWFVSVGYTAGGLFYSLRALAPAFALLVVAAGQGAAALRLSTAAGRWLAVGLAVVALEALPKTLTLPDNPYRLPVRAWLGASRRIGDSFHGDAADLVAKLSQLPGPHRVVSDGFDLPSLAESVGFDVIPPWSPDIDWLFNPALDPADAARRWQTSGVRFLIFGRTGAMVDYLGRHVRSATPYYHIEPVDQTTGHVIFEIKATGKPVP